MAQRQVAERQLEHAKATAANDVNVRYSKAAAKVSEAELAAAQSLNELATGAVSAAEVRRLELASEALHAGDRAGGERPASQWPGQPGAFGGTGGRGAGRSSPRRGRAGGRHGGRDSQGARRMGAGRRSRAADRAARSGCGWRASCRPSKWGARSWPMAR